MTQVVPHSKHSASVIKTVMIMMYRAKVTILIKIQPDATVCRYLFTAKSLYMFRVSTAPIIKSTKNCNRSTHDDGCGGHPKYVE